MNERIKELAEQSDMIKILSEHASEHGNGTFENTSYPELEKFAELIVRECVDWCNAYATVDGTAQKIAGSIKEHFGVEYQKSVGKRLMDKYSGALSDLAKR